MKNENWKIGKEESVSYMYFKSRGEEKRGAEQSETFVKVSLPFDQKEREKEREMKR